MPRKPTGNPPGRPPLKRRADGTLDHTRNKLSPKAQKALAAELHFWRLQAKGKADDGPWPVRASASRVARRANIKPRAVQKLRKKGEVYETQFWVRVLAPRLDGKNEKTKAEKAAKQVVFDTPDGKKLLDWAKAHWPKENFVKSLINGRRYHSPETYVRHLRAHGCIPHDWISVQSPARNR